MAAISNDGGWPDRLGSWLAAKVVAALVAGLHVDGIRDLGFLSLWRSYDHVELAILGRLRWRAGLRCRRTSIGKPNAVLAVRSSNWRLAMGHG